MQGINIMKLDKYAMHKYIGVIIMDKDENNNQENKNSGDEIRRIRESTGMNRKEFAEYFGIPYPTITDWELGHRKMPDYLLRLIAYKVEMEKLIKK